MKNAFIDPTSSVLKAYGYVSSNQPGDVLIPVPDAFALERGLWQWDGMAWVPFVPPPPIPNPLKALITTAVADPTVPTTLKTLLTTWRTQL